MGKISPIPCSLSNGWWVVAEPEEDCGLFGLSHSNRTGSNLWGKNQFNSTFPAALCCYMLENKIPATYVNIGKSGKILNGDISIANLFGTRKALSKLYLNFEGRFKIYESTVLGSLERVDLVVSAAAEQSNGKVIEGEQFRALEVKLTVVPDNSTFAKPESEWGPELVIRPATTKYCAMSMAHTCVDAKSKAKIRKIFEKPLASVKGWGNEVEALSILQTTLNCLEEFEEAFSERQVPLVLQPIWKTEGKSPVLAKQAFDMFVWSNFALARLIRDQSMGCVGGDKITRPARSALRLARYLLEFSRSGNPHIANIYNDMTYGYQSDKDFSVNGGITRKYLTSGRVSKPRIPRSVVNKIILGDGVESLSPERRFDQSIYFLSKYK